MELKSFQVKTKAFISKNKYVVFIIVLGLVFMLIPSKTSSEKSIQNQPVAEQQPKISIEERLSDILKQIEGAGKVEVMLTVAKGEETVYQTDNEITSESDNVRQNTNTVTVTDANRNQSGLVRQRVSPIYLGAIVVCQGADDPNIRLAVTEAVAKVTGLKSNHISVLKMK